MRWINAKDRLPKEGGLYHFKNDSGLHDVVFYSDKHGFYKPKVKREAKTIKEKAEIEIKPLPYKLENIFWLDETESEEVSKEDVFGKNKSSEKANADESRTEPRIDYDAEYWDVVAYGKRFTCYNEEDARLLLKQFLENDMSIIKKSNIYEIRKDITNSEEDIRQQIWNILYKGECVLDKIMEVVSIQLSEKDMSIISLSDKIRNQEEETAKLKTVMIAAAEEINAYWDAHCDKDGYGPSSLMRRLEQGIPVEYGYTAGRFKELKEQNEQLQSTISKQEEEIREKGEQLKYCHKRMNEAYNEIHQLQSQLQKVTEQLSQQK